MNRRGATFGSLAISDAVVIAGGHPRRCFATPTADRRPRHRTTPAGDC
jgi:hypothetical protein